MNNEQVLVLELCNFMNPNREKINNLLDNSIDYPFVLGQLIYNRVGAIAYETIKRCNLKAVVNREFYNSLALVFDNNYERVSNYLKTIEKLNKILKEDDFPYALLKGAYLSSIYPIGLRTSNDIDILIEQKHITKLAELLIKNGFSQGHLKNGKFEPATRLEIINSRMNRGETIPFVKQVDLPRLKYCEIDINFSLDSVAHQKTDTVYRMLLNTRRMASDAAYTLSETDFLIHLCVHLFKEAAVINWVRMGRDLSLYKFCDIYLLLEKWLNENFARELTKKIHDYQLEKECYYALNFTKVLFEIDNIWLTELLSQIRPDNIEYLYEVVDISENKKYFHKMNFIDWFFCGNRNDLLIEKN